MNWCRNERAPARQVGWPTYVHEELVFWVGARGPARGDMAAWGSCVRLEAMQGLVGLLRVVITASVQAGMEKQTAEGLSAAQGACPMDKSWSW